MVDIGYRILRPANFLEKVARRNTGFLSELFASYSGPPSFPICAVLLVAIASAALVRTHGKS